MSQNLPKNSASDEKFIQMTTQPVEKLVCKLAVPTIISMLITTFYNLVDTLFVRQLENDSMVAAVGVVLPLMSIIQAFGFFFGHGSGNYISRAFGRRDYKDAEIMATTGFVYAVSIGIFLAVFGIIFRNPLAVILGAKTEATIAATVDYMVYILIGAPVMMGSVVLNNQLRMQGNAFFAMLGLTAGSVLNIVLDPLLIFSKGDVIFGSAVTVPFGAGMGIAGAALATSASQCVSLILLFIALIRSDNIKINLKNFSPKFYYLKGVFQGGLPSLARQGLASLATTCLNHAVGIYLVSDVMIDAAQAAMTGTSKLMLFLSSALIGFGQGFQPVCGFNYGAGKYDRVCKAYYFCVKVAVVALLIITVIGFIFAEPIIKTVACTSPLAAEIAAFTFRAQLLTFPLMSWVILCNMLLQNIGMTVRATVVAMARQGLTFVPIVLLLPLVISACGGDPLVGIQLSQSVADLLSLGISLPIGIAVLKQLKNSEIPAKKQ
ncbi:MAG: MATE family efflux transporter [Oscillospiraceae bacterium]|nr:MATE family efflux transporter [Oscillospiraceae bacterium]